MTESLKLPVGIEDFAEIRQAGFYYVDKTKFIEQLLDGWGKVNLFTRPRRFGKTLNMSMLRYFFEIGADASLFDGLQIAKNKKLCEEYQGKYPVIFLSFKNVEGLTFVDAQYRLAELIAGEAERFAFLAQSDKLTENERSLYCGLTAVREGRYALADEVLVSALQLLSKLLSKHYGQKTIILLDEYDVPLDKAFQNGYYKEMVSLIRGMLGQALKTNEFLQFAVLTGCLRVSKESIFTGLNNFKVLSITDNRFDEQFGFTDAEVEQLLAAYNLADHLEETKAWYDGYRFGDADVYCPWDVINHVDVLRSNPSAKPQAYWINTSGNALVKLFIEMADKSTRDELERLVTDNVQEPHQGKVDLSAILNNPFAGKDQKVTFDPKAVYNFELEKTMDEKVLVKKCANAINKGQKTELSVNLTNIDRTFGTILGAEITRKNKNGLADDTITVHCNGAGGMS